MKFQLNITGDFTNIQGMSAELTFPATLTCPSCGYKHPKTVILTKDSSKSEKKIYKCNFEMSCHSCKAEMRITIDKPPKPLTKQIKDYYGDPMDVEYYPVGVHGCTVAIFETNGVKIDEVKDVALSILTEDDKWFENNHAEETRVLTGEYPPNKIYSIVNYKNEIVQLKK